MLLAYEKEKFEEIMARYVALVPPPLSSQFKNKDGRAAAIKSFKEKQQKEAVSLFPSGKSIFASGTFRMCNLFE